MASKTIPPPISQMRTISDSGTQSLRVCIVAENASLQFGGEAAIPLHYFSGLRRRGVEAWLVVHGRTRDELEALLPCDQSRIRYIEDRWFHRLIWRLGRHLPRRVSEATFGFTMVLLNQVIQRGIIARLVTENGVSVIHQPIPVSPKAPSLIGHLGVPVVIGPMNGGMTFPKAFRRDESWFTRLTIAVGHASATFANRLFSGKRNASILLVANQRTRLALPKGLRGLVIQIPENGVDLNLWSITRRPTTCDGRNFLFVGRLVDWKRVDFLLRSLVDYPEATLKIIGDGPMRAAWSMLAHDLGVSTRVTWLGWLSQAECAVHMNEATALLLPSIYESGGAVALEAMACGIPVVATAWGGPLDYINSRCGILVDASDAQTIIKGFVEALRLLTSNPTLGQQLGRVGRHRVETLFDWEKKIDQMLNVYGQAMQRFSQEKDEGIDFSDSR